MPSDQVMPKFARGQLHSGGPNGPVVRTRSQAIAIAASERDKEKQNGGVYPEPKGTKKLAYRRRS